MDASAVARSTPAVIPPIVVFVSVVILGAALARHMRRSRALPVAVEAVPDHRHRHVSRLPDVAMSARPIAVGLLAMAGVATVGPLLVLTVVGMTVVARRLGPLRRARRQRRATDAALPDAIDLFVLLVQAGRTPYQAVDDLVLRAPAAVRPAFEAVHARLVRGDPLSEALTALRTELGPGVTALVDLVGSADRYGLPLAPVLAQLADQARADRRRLGEASARSLPVRLSFPLVVCTLPSFVLLAIVPAVMGALSSLGSTPW